LNTTYQLEKERIGRRINKRNNEYRALKRISREGTQERHHIALRPFVLGLLRHLYRLKGEKESSLGERKTGTVARKKRNSSKRQNRQKEITHLEKDYERSESFKGSNGLISTHCICTRKTCHGVERGGAVKKKNGGENRLRSAKGDKDLTWKGRNNAAFCLGA